VNGTAPITLRDSLSRPRWTSGATIAPLAQAAVMLLSLAVFLTLFVLRAQDDNRLTSWQWVFSDADVFRITPILVVGLLLAAVLARVPFPGRRPASVLFVLSFAVGALSWAEPEVNESWNQGCSREVWFRTRSTMTEMPRSWAAAMKAGKSSLVP